MLTGAGESKALRLATMRRALAAEFAAWSPPGAREDVLAGGGGLAALAVALVSEPTARAITTAKPTPARTFTLVTLPPVASPEFTVWTGSRHAVPVTS